MPRLPGQFSASRSGHKLFDAVAEIARAAAASPELASGISKNRFNETRRRLGRFDVPTADAIRQRLGRPWEQVLRVALAAPEDRGRGFGQGQGHDDGDEFAGPDALGLAAVRSTALEAGGLPSMDAYDLLLARRNRQRERQGLAPLALPGAQTLINRHGSWKGALKAAGLEVEGTATQAAAREESRFRPAEEILSELIDLIGVLPGRGYLERFCTAWDIPLSSKEIKNHFDDVVERARALRASAGKWTPQERTPPRRCPSIPTPPPQSGPRRRRARRHSLENVLESLRRYGERHLEARQLPTERHYRACREIDAELLSLHSFPTTLLFQELCREAGL